MVTPAATPPRQLDRPAGWWCYTLIWGFAAWMAPMLTSTLSDWWLPAIGLGTGVLGVALVRVCWPKGNYGEKFSDQACLFAMVLGVALGAWLLRVRWYGDNIPLWQEWLIGCSVLGGWWILLALWAPKAAADMDARRRSLPLEPLPEQIPFEPFHTILRKSGLIPAVRILDVTESPSGGVKSVHVRPVDLPDKSITTFDTLRNKVATLSTHADRLIDGIDIDEQDVTLQKVTSSRWIIHFTVKRVLTDPRPYPIRTTPRPPGEPSRLGNYETDVPLDLNLFTPDHGASHVDLVAGTGGGKTTCLHNMIAEDNACDSWEVWLFATQKLSHVAWPWIRPWLQGKTDRPPVDAIFGQSQEQILRGLMWACQLASDWNDGTDAVREVLPGKGGLTLIIDESSDCLRRPERIKFRMGANWVEYNASEMVAKLAEISRTSPIKLARASQYGLFDAAGSAGPESRRNFLAAVIGKVNRPSDANNVAPGMPGGWDATKLRNYMIFVQPNLEDPTVLRAKMWALAKEAVDPVAIAYAPWRNGLDPEATRKLVGYGERWDPRYHPELVRFAKKHGLEWPLQSGQILAPRGTLTSGPATPASPLEPPVPVPAGPAGPPDQENPMPDDAPLPDDWKLPAGWTDEEFDVLAAIAADTGQTGAAADTEQPTMTGSVLANPDLGPMKKANRKLSAEADRYIKMTKLPDPLGRILIQLMNPKAQRVVSTGWVPTEILAEVLGRFSDDADEKARKQAVQQLGWDINKVTGLKSAEIPRPVLAQLELPRCYGWKVDELRTAGERLMANIPDDEVA